ncbi:ParB N-terminal domain-containing protein [Pseudoruegeria sp. SK021]|uniref:ParB/RepB/Spo0J family partition protein n=1 Tax=Pseudoruegeria sp. SK021 TaxID=1933035 RepID=UPI000A244AD1|nr:ParB N-terminal domain-containing protein [Pseudoruegeria sp. SK021]OSP55826.1 hypothetical protein BV911_05485 [Pseudoruegeria sp. SK021]
MSRKRRMFDIDMPEETPVSGDDAPRISSVGDRRGPMASAVRENVDSLRDRAEREQAIRAENDALAHEFVALKAQGLVLQRLPLAEVHAAKLTRDRREVDIDDLQELKDSINEIGLSNPIQVEVAGDGYELVQGARRLSAFRALFQETGDERFASIPAVVLEAGETLDALYRRMVDENLIRTDISFAEMAALARSYADDPATTVATVDEAVQVLYRSAAKQKRSYIRAFAQLLQVLEPHLSFPQAIPRALGLAVRKRIEDEPDSVALLLRRLRSATIRTAEDELVLLRAFTGEGPAASAGSKNSVPVGSAKPARRARTTFQIRSAQGDVRCTASQGRIELKLDTDFTAMDRRKLEEAVRQFLGSLEGQGGG